MTRSDLTLHLILLSCVLTSVTSRVTYPSQPSSVLAHLSSQDVFQDHVTTVFHQDLVHLNTTSLLVGLGEVLKSHREESPTLKFKSEAAARASPGGQCTQDFDAYIGNIDRYSWAQRMLDATGKPGAGLMNGGFLFLGDFDECQEVKANYSSPKPAEFRGQYCLAQYGASLVRLPSELSTGWAFCVPDSCKEGDVLDILNRTLARLNVTAIEFESVTCNSRSVPLTSRSVGVFSMVVVMVTVVLLGTAADIMLVQLPKWRVRQEMMEDLGSLLPGGPGHVVQVKRDELPGTTETDPVIINNNNAAHVPMRSRQSLLVRILVAFSAWTNTENILSTRQPTGSLACLNGLRVISINWVVLGHTVLLLARNGNNAIDYAQKAIKRWTFQAVVNATPSVDTFFVLSGVLVAYVTLNNLKKTAGKANWLMFYVHRYLRLTPVYMIVMGIYLGTLPHLINGPLFDQKNGFEPDPHCSNTWWGNPLYVQNLVKFKPHFCMGWSWYLAVDMQFYVLSPLLLLPLHHRPRLGYLLAGLFLFTSTITPLVLSETRKYGINNPLVHLKGHPKPRGDEFYDIYISPYCRMGPYVVGVLLGHVLSRMNRKPVKIRKSLVILGWAAALVTGLAVVYGLLPYYRGTDMDPHAAALYNGFSRTAWAVSVAWVIFSCVTGHGGVVNTFLSWSLWAPLSRLTYVVYLIHVIVLNVWIVTSRTPLFASDFTVAMLYLAALTTTYGLALLISVLFEAPGVTLEKILLRAKK